MSANKFAQPIEAMRSRLRALQQPTGETPMSQQELLAEAFEQLSITLEELLLVQEQLNQQHKDLKLEGEFAECRQTQEALKASEKRFRSIFEAAAIGMAIVDLEGHVIESNAALQQMLGYSSQALRTMTVDRLTHPDDLAADLELFSEVLSGKRDSYQVEKRYIRKDGEVVWGRLTVSAVRGDAGEVQFAIGMVEDITGRKQAQEALKQSEEQLRLALDAGQMGIWDWNVLTGSLKWSERLEPMHGFAPGTFDGSFEMFASVIHPEDREFVMGSIARALEEGTDYEVEYRIVLPDGSIRWKGGKGKVFYNEMGQAVRMIGVGTDITQRKQMEQELRESNRKIANILESITDGFVTFDRKWRFTYVNPEAARQLQRNPEELIGKNVWEEFPELLENRCYGEYCQAVEKQQPVAFESFYPPLNKWFETHAYPSSEGLTVYFQNTSDRKQMQRERRETEEHLRMALEAAKMGTWDWNLLAGEVRWSKNHEQLFGLAPGSFDGTYQAFLNSVHPEDRESVAQLVSGSLENREGYEQEFRTLWPDGSVRWIAAKGQFFYDEIDRPVRMMGVCMDITHRKQAEEERERLLAREQAARADAEAANRMKDEFLAIVSHELRSPLNPILGWTQLLRSRKMNQIAIDRALETIERNVKSQLNIIDDLLDVSRIIRGKLRLNVRPVELLAVIEAAADTARSSAQAKEIELVLTVARGFEPSPIVVAGDSDRLQQVVWNLLSNAIKFTPPGGRVEVRLSAVMEEGASESEQSAISPFPITNVQCSVPYAQIQVIDTGKGISPEFVPFVFDRFRQADGSIARSHGGLGLGLAIARSLVESHGGSVCADSPGEGRGATFTVKLPLYKSAEERVKSAEPENSLQPKYESLSSLSGLRVLIVDDLCDARDLLVTVLQEYEAEAIAAASAREALEAVERFRPDVLVSDIGMPGLDGYGLIRQIRALEAERGGRIPAVALTAYAREEDRQQALEAGFQKHVPKPVEPAALAQVIANLVGRGGTM